MSGEERLLRIRGLCIRAGSRVLVKDMDLDISRHELLGIAGESGSGKTMLMRALLQVLPEGVSMEAQQLELFGRDCLKLPPQKWRHLVGSHVGFVPQNTVEGLHPMLKIRSQIADSYVSYRKGSRAQGLCRAADLLREVGLEDPQRVLDSYPWELSGGMRQRVNIAMALMNSPQLLIADEPTTALDAAVARQTMELLMTISRETDIAIVMITHDLTMLRQYSRRAMVMYAGRMVELGDTETLFQHPAHPYTRALTAVLPTIGRDRPQRLPEIPGNVPERGRETEGCIFAPRCPHAAPECAGKLALRELGEGHVCLCARAGGGEHG